MVRDNKIMSVIGYNRSVIVEVGGCVMANSERITNPMIIPAEIAMANREIASLRNVRVEENGRKYIISAAESGTSAPR